MAIKERKQLSGSTTAISEYAGHEGQVVWDKTKKEFVGMSGTVGKTYPVAMKDFVINELGKKADTEQLSPLATKEELKPLAKDADVLKLIAQSLTPEQKAQVVKNLEDTFLPLDLSKRLTGNNILRNTDSDYLTICGGINTSNNSYISLIGSKNSSRPDNIEILPGGYSKGGGLVCSSNGTIEWRQHQVDYVVARGNTWIRYASGIQICWGLEHYPDVAEATITFPAPFHDSPAVLVSGIGAPHTTEWNPLTANIVIVTGSLDYFSWVAIGYWKEV